MTTTVGQASRRLTRDWATQFPELSIWRSRWLVRRVGPLLQGIHLERASDPTIYSPTSHVHVLAQPWPDIVLTLRQRLDNSHIALRFHDQELVAAAARLREQTALPLDRVPALPEVLGAFRTRALTAGMPAESVHTVEGSVLVAGAAGDTTAVEECIEFARSISSRWDPDLLGLMGKDLDWLDQLAARAQDRAELRRVAESEVERHKLTNVETVEMPTDGTEPSALSG